MTLKSIVSLLLACAFLFLTACSDDTKVSPKPEQPDTVSSSAEPSSQEQFEAASFDEEFSRFEEPDSSAYVGHMTLENANLQEEMTPLSSAPAAHTLLMPVASGKQVKSGGGADIDYSNVQDGYVMVRFSGDSGSRLKVQVGGPTTTYTYDLLPGAWTTFPLSDGNGGYQVRALQNVEGQKYAVLTAVSFEVSLKDEFAPFIRPNQYVNYEKASATIKKAEELAGRLSAPLDKVQAIYTYVVDNFTYDQQKAQTVKSGYLPVLDDILASKKGICFDYAAVMTGMLRSQGVPCKLVVGYAGSAYHAWVSVWTEETGWIDGVIFFDGTTWQRMDPTFASSGSANDAILQYIGDGSNYTEKYLY